MEEKSRDNKQMTAQWEQLCVSLKYSKDKCKNCRYRGYKPDNSRHCPYYTPDCFALETTLAKKEIADRSNRHIKLIDRYKAFIDKVREYVIKPFVNGK